MEQREHPHIALLLWLGQEYAAQVARGVLEYAQTAAFGKVDIIRATARATFRQTFDPFDAVIAILDNNEVGALQYAQIPKVLVPRLAVPGSHLSVGTDARQVGKLAAEHLLSLRLSNFALLSHADVVAQGALESGFRDTILAAGGNLVGAAPIVSNLTNWVVNLPVPCGVLTPRDGIAENLISCAKDCGRRIPEDIAIISIGDDLMQCLATRPSVTSLTLPTRQIGHAAAALLDRWLRHGDKPAGTILLPPSDVIARDSTRTVVLADEKVAAAVRYIRDHFAHPIRAIDVARHVHLSRKGLHIRFQVAMGHSVHDELVQCRLKKAQTMLANTQESIKVVAASVGMPELPNFSRFIRQHTGQTPALYRKQNLPRQLGWETSGQSRQRNAPAPST